MSTSQLNYSYGGVEGRNFLKPNGGATVGPSSMCRVEGRNYLKPNGGIVAGRSSLRLRPPTHQGPLKNTKAPITTINGNDNGLNITRSSSKAVGLSLIRLRPPTHQEPLKSSKVQKTTTIVEDIATRKSTSEEKAAKAAKTDAAKKSHKDAERRRRERINNNLGTLRGMVMDDTTKTDKASLLTTVVKRVKELKRRAADALHIGDASKTKKPHWTIPSEIDEIVVEFIKSEESPETIAATEEAGTEEERSANKKKLNRNSPVEMKTKPKHIKVTFNCEDRIDLYKDLNRAIKNLKANLFKADMTTVGGRIKGIFIIETGCGLGVLNQIALGRGGSSNAVLVDELGTVRRALKAVIEKATRMTDYGHHQRRFNPYYQ